jgi:arylsulfatase A-like enzyme
MAAHAPYHRVPEEALAARRAAVEADDRSLSRDAQRAIARIARDARNRPLVERGLPPNLALFELAYDMGVEHFDRALGAFLRGFERLEASRGAAVVVTSDHGEALFAHGWQSHGHGLYEDETGIPLAAHLPGVATTGRVGCPVGLIDLRRTLCEYLGVPCEGEGVSFFSDAIADPQRLVWTESVIARPRNRAVRTAHYKLLYEPDGRLVEPARPEPFELYDLARDPRERRDLLDAGRAEADARLAFQRLRAEAERSAAGPRATAERTVLDEETRERLEALGYLDPEE